MITRTWYHFVRYVPYILNLEEMCNFEFASNEHRKDRQRVSWPNLSAFVYILWQKDPDLVRIRSRIRTSYLWIRILEAQKHLYPEHSEKLSKNLISTVLWLPYN